jgi:hypothetical protein
MEPLSITECRKLMGQALSESLEDADIVRLRDMLYSLADVISDAFIDLENVDQSTFVPPGDALDAIEKLVSDDILLMTGEGVSQ